MGTPLLRGRVFNSRDTKDSPPVIIVNDLLAQRFFPDGNAIGQQIVLIHGDNSQPSNQPSPPKEIVGVVGGSRHESLAIQPLPEFYIPAAQDPNRRMDVVIRTAASDPVGLQTSLRNIVHEFDKDLFVPTLEPLEKRVGVTLSQPRFNMMLLGTFAGVAMVLAAIGIYGVIAYSVALRTKEIGIRMALGAQKIDMLSLILRQTLVVVGIGLVVGLVSSLITTRLMASLLFGVSANDFTTYAIVLALLGHRGIDRQLSSRASCYECRSRRGAASRVMNDLNFALRQLSKSPGFTFVAVLTLAVGIGINVAMYSLIYAVLLSELPFPEADRLVSISETWADGISPMSYPDYLDWKAAQHSFEEIAVARRDDFNLTGNGEPERFSGLFVTASYFRALKIPPKLGRTFFDEEDSVAGVNPVVLSEHLWRSRFGADPTIVGRKLVLNTISYEVVGVAAESLSIIRNPETARNSQGARNADLYAPFGFYADRPYYHDRRNRGDFMNRPIEAGRLDRAGESRPQAHC